MNNKGFTLIELLAVVVILAIIALIVTPIVLGIIGDAREESNERSVELYAKAVQDGLVLYRMKNKKAVKPGKYTSETLPFEVDYSGDIECDLIEIKEDNTVSLAGCIVNESEEEYAYGNPYTDSSCFNIKEVYDYEINEQVCLSLFGSMADNALGEGAGSLICSGDKTYGDIIDLANEVGYTKDQLEQAGVLKNIKVKGVSIAGYSCAISDVAIPKQIDNKNVIGIEYEAFMGKQLTSVVIPKGVTYIRDYAFNGNRLTSVVIPDGVTNIGDDAFSYNNLTSVVIPESVSYIGGHVFSDNQLTSIVIPKSVTHIGWYSFTRNQNIKIIIKNKQENVDLEFPIAGQDTIYSVIWEG